MFGLIPADENIVLPIKVRLNSIFFRKRFHPYPLFQINPIPETRIDYFRPYS